MKQEKNISKPTTKLLHPEGKPWVIFAFLENQDHVRLLENEIEKITQSYRLEIFQHYDQLSKTEEYKGHLIIADYTLAIQENNLLLRCIMHNDKHMPLIVLSTVPGENHAVEAIKQGANNYFLWDELKALGSAITSCLLPSSITKKPVQTKIDFHDYEKFFSFSLDLFCIAYQGNFLHLNKRWETVLGYTRDELEGQPIFSFIHPDDIVSTRQASAMVQKSGRILDFQNRYRHKDGSYRNFVWSSYLHDGYIYATANDI
ncbi:MAG: PAS domain-containing protein [Sumerlaeia bacterium]